MTAVVFSFTDKGSKLSLKIARLLIDFGYSVEQYAMPKYCDPAWQQPLIPDLSTLTARLFATAKLLVYVGATGIAVRAIAPLVKDKKTDPAVICLDELGQFTIPLLSGHIGGANRLAKYLARGLDSIPVITTATDINQLPAIDEWATLNNLHIADMRIAQRIAADLLDGKRIGMINNCAVDYQLPQGFVADKDTDLGVVIAENTNYSPYKQTLFLLPRNIYLGIGCRQGVDMQAIEGLVLERLSELNIDMGRVVAVSSIDLKRNELGILKFIEKYHLRADFYRAEQLKQLSGEFSASEFVCSVTGVDNVCERAAVLRSGGRLLARKCSSQGVTLAIAVKPIENELMN